MTKQKLSVSVNMADWANRPKMSETEKAARLYIGRKMNERRAKIERRFLFVWACLAIGAIVAPFILF